MNRQEISRQIIDFSRERFKPFLGSDVYSLMVYVTLRFLTFIFEFVAFLRILRGKYQIMHNTEIGKEKGKSYQKKKKKSPDERHT